MTRPAGVAEPEGVPLSFTACPGDNDYQRGHSYYIPFITRNSITTDSAVPDNQMQLAVEEKATAPEFEANLSLLARKYLSSLGLPDPDADADTAALIWLHALAIGYSPAYLSENQDGIRRDWPRIALLSDQ